MTTKTLAQAFDAHPGCYVDVVTHTGAVVIEVWEREPYGDDAPVATYATTHATATDVLADFFAGWDQDELAECICEVTSATATMVDDDGSVWIERGEGDGHWLSANETLDLIRKLQRQGGQR